MCEDRLNRLSLARRVKGSEALRCGVGRTEALEFGAMAGVLGIAMFFDFWRLSENGFGNFYYAAAVRSMAQNWHTFLYASYDPGGYISVDKPPLGLWIQVASVKLFGFTWLGLLGPQALMGVLAVAVLWRVVRRWFGRLAGVLAALALAISPTNVVSNRDNILEPALVLTVLLAVWAMTRAVERGAWRWLLTSAFLIGLGFNIKMLEAYLVVPALAGVYLCYAPTRWRKRLAQLSLAGVVMLGVSLAWITFVQLTPPAQRPYVGSTSDNSVFSLAFGYNGLGRLLGGSSPHTMQDIPGREPHAGSILPIPSGRFARHGSLSPHTVYSLPGSAGLKGSGKPGPLRLIQPRLGSQGSWLLPLALFGLALGLGNAMLEWRRRRRAVAPEGKQPLPEGGIHVISGSTRQRAGYLLWGGWLLVTVGVLSEARFINAYYVAILAPAVCALAGIGGVAFWRHYHAALTAEDSVRSIRRRLLGGLLPLALLATAIEQANLMRAAPNWPNWGALALPCALAGMAIGLGAWLFTANRRGAGWSWGELWTWHTGRRSMHTLASAFAAVGLCSSLIAPLAWSGLSLTWGNSNGWPVAGPQYAALKPAPKLFVDPYLINYLLAHRGGARFVVATTDAYWASPIIVTTGLPVLAMGGFSGADPVLTPQTLEQLVAHNTVRYFLLPSSNVTLNQFLTLFPQALQVRSGAPLAVSKLATVGGSHRLSIPANLGRFTNTLTAWVSQHCAPIPPPLWSSAVYVRYRLGATQLFACHPFHTGRTGARRVGGR